MIQLHALILIIELKGLHDIDSAAAATEHMREPLHSTLNPSIENIIPYM